VSGKRPVEYHRPGRVKGHAGLTLALMRAVEQDARAQELSVPQLHALLYAIRNYSNGAGQFWPGRDTWARAARVGETTIRELIRKAEASGLIEVASFRRPNAVTQNAQGSNNYYLDPKLVDETFTRVCQGDLMAPMGASDAGMGSDPNMGARGAPGGASGAPLQGVRVARATRGARGAPRTSTNELTERGSVNEVDPQADRHGDVDSIDGRPECEEAHQCEDGLHFDVHGDVTGRCPYAGSATKARAS
jgi:hypothetical protein